MEQGTVTDDRPGSATLGELQIRDYLEIASYRKWWIILTTIALSIVSWVVAGRLPSIYSAQSVILIDPQKVPDSYVPSTISSNIADRLATIKQQVLSPSRLKRLINTMNLYPQLRVRRSEQEIIEIMQKAATVDLVGSGTGRLSSFSIKFTGKNPTEVAQVANQLATMFIEENLKAREQQSSGTTEFLDTELEQAKKQLEQKEKDLGTIKSRYIMDLPDSKQYHLEQLTTLRNQLKDIQERISRAQQERIFIQSQNFTPVIDLDTTRGTGGASPYRAQIEKLETRLAELQSRYGPNHPDVRKVQKEIAQLKPKAAAEEEKQPAEAPSQPISPNRRRNPVLEARLEQLNKEIEDQTRLQPHLQEQIDFHVSKLERVPIFEQQISGLMRDYDNIRAHYSRLLDKKLSADMANALENRQKVERWVVLDPAIIPEKPYAPNRLLIRLAGLLGGLLGGIALAVMAEMADESVRNEREAARIIGKPALVGIPRILNGQQHRREMLRAVGAVAGTAIGATGLGLLIARAAEWIL
jgi:polysaccharide chain length determinant protein (PEP-CTERM system associated)